MAFDDVYVISDKRDPATEDQMRTAQASLHTRFPPDYEDYVTLLGAGYLNEDVHVLPPTEIIERTIEYREIEAELTSAEADGFSRWELVEHGLDLFPPDRLLAAVLLIDPGDGHRIVFHPDAPDELLFIPHDDEAIYRVGSTVDEALTWFLETGP